MPLHQACQALTHALLKPVLQLYLHVRNWNQAVYHLHQISTIHGPADRESAKSTAAALHESLYDPIPPLPSHAYSTLCSLCILRPQHFLCPEQVVHAGHVRFIGCAASRMTCQTSIATLGTIAPREERLMSACELPSQLDDHKLRPTHSAEVFPEQLAMVWWELPAEVADTPSSKSASSIFCEHMRGTNSGEEPLPEPELYLDFL